MLRAPEGRTALRRASELPSGALPVPLVVQATDYSCGAAALLSVLFYWKVYDGVETALYKDLDTTEKDGTEPDKMAAYAEKIGLRVEMRQQLTLDDLKTAVSAGDTVILDFQSGPKPEGKQWKDVWDEGHYAVLVAMDKQNLYLMDPAVTGAYEFVPRDEFVERWHDYEDRGGVVRRHYELGIRIRGERPMTAFPGRLVKMGEDPSRR